jgi:hypothetical protein
MQINYWLFYSAMVGKTQEYAASLWQHQDSRQKEDLLGRANYGTNWHSFAARPDELCARGSFGNCLNKSLWNLISEGQ